MAIIKLVEIAIIPPPVGTNLFAVVLGADGNFHTIEVFVGVLPSVFVEFISLGLLFAFPAIAIFSPAKMISR